MGLEGVAWVAFGSGALSLCGCVLTLVAFGLVVRPTSATSRLLVALTAADVLQALFFMLAPLQLQKRPESAACSVQAVLGIVTATASFLWTLAIAAYVFWVAASPRTAAISLSASSSAVIPTAHIVAWGYPLAFLAALFAAHPHITFSDPHAPWCFLPHQYPFWRLTSVYVPLVVCWLATSALYVAARAKLKAHVSRNHHFAKFVAIPLGFVVLRAWGMAYRLLEFSADDDARPARWLLYLTVIGDPLQGAYNCAVFVLASAPVRAALFAFLTCSPAPPPSSPSLPAPRSLAPRSALLASPHRRRHRSSSASASASASPSPPDIGYRVIEP